MVAAAMETATVGLMDAGCAAGEGWTLAQTRHCLRPDRCPYAGGGGGGLAGCPDVWRRALLALLPGDPELVLEIVGDVAEETGEA
jgi:hypothetical protein